MLDKKLIELILNEDFPTYREVLEKHPELITFCISEELMDQMIELSKCFADSLTQVPEEYNREEAIRCFRQFVLYFLKAGENSLKKEQNLLSAEEMLFILKKIEGEER